MAGADYYSCDVCGRKAFYDANLNYDFDKRDAHGNPKLDYVGAMVCICDDCATTHKIEVVAIAAPTDAKADALSDDDLLVFFNERDFYPDNLGDPTRFYEAVRELMANGQSVQSVRDALEQAVDALDEAGSKLQTEDKSHDFWMGVGAAVEAGESAIRALIQSPQDGGDK